MVTHIERSPVDVSIAMKQWEGYLRAFVEAGWPVTEVEPAPACPDSVFVEDTVVVYGDKDSFVDQEWAERVATLLPRGRLRIVAGEPHAVHYTRPELIAGLVGELVIEEGQHASRELRRRLEHGNVSATKVRQPDVDHCLPPFLRNRERHEAVALAPYEKRRRTNARQLVSQITAPDERDSAGEVERPGPSDVDCEHR